MPSESIRPFIIIVLLAGPAVADEPSVTAPPTSFFELVRERDRDVARDFYKKYVDIHGLPVVSSAEIADAALLRTYEIVDHMLAGRPDIRQTMIDAKMYLIIIGRDQLYTDMPEYRNSRNKDYLNERVRGTGGNPTSFGEENLLSLPLDRYDDESIAVHEFCHTIDNALRILDPQWRERRNEAYRHAMSQGLYKLAYAAGNPGEYWAEIAQTYFDSQRVNNWNHGPIGTREQLRVYDPIGYELCRTTFNLKPDQDWRYSWLQKLPNVTRPPKRFQIDPYYTKFTWAREMTVVGRGASDATLLKANDTIRKMFAYRHDILKALIADDVKLVVLNSEERLADLPELTRLKNDASADLLARMFDYRSDARLLVVDEANVLSDPADPHVGCNQILRVFAKAILLSVAKRDVDPNWDKRGRAVQQYELRVQRIDVRFDQKVQALFEKMMAADKWKGTSAVHNHIEYWATGVLAYFDALGQDAAPNDAPHPISTRERLKSYDPELFALVAETMAYEGHVDWRFSPGLPSQASQNN